MADRDVTAVSAAKGEVALPEAVGQRCAHCGKPARVCVLHGYRDGAPVKGYYCLECPTGAPLPERTAGRSRARVGLPFLVCLAGVLLGLAGGTADLIDMSGSAGFGWYQRSGVLVGAVFVLLGVLLRADVVALGGVFLFGAALSWDWFGFSATPGIGWKQQAALALAAGLLAIAVGVKVMARRRAQARAR